MAQSRYHSITEPRVGKQDTLADGVAFTAEANTQAGTVYTVPEDLHIDEVVVGWEGFVAGDRGWLAILHPASVGNPAADVAGDQLDVGALAGYYNPGVGAQHVEFWDAAGTTLLEVVGIASITNSMVTLAKTPEGTYTTTNVIKARFQSFNPVRGSHGMDGGFFFLGGGMLQLGAPNEMTDVVSAGMVLCIGLATVTGGSTRSLGINFVFRKPEVA
jgi:hypothetical protein